MDETKPVNQPEATENAASASKRQYQRSPGYPAIDLETAIEKAKALYDKETKSWANVDVVIGHLGYQSQSGNALRTLAALEKYGLIEDQGKGAQRRARLTSAALDIILESGSEKAARAIQECASRPVAFKKALDYFEGSLPSDQNLNRHLIDEGFTKAGALDFIRVIRANVAFAGQSNYGNMSPEGANAEPQAPAQTNPYVAPVGGTMPATQPVAQPAGGMPIRVPIGPQEYVDVIGLHPMPRDQWDKFKKRLTTMLQMYEEDWAIQFNEQDNLAKQPSEPES